MKPKSLLCIISLVLVTFLISSCGGGGGTGGDGDKVTVNYMPNFSFEIVGTTSSSLFSQNLKTESLVLPGGNKEAMATYYLVAPMMVGFTKGPKTLANGEVLSYNFGSTQLKLKVSSSGNIVKLAGSFEDNSGSMEIVLNTAQNTFSYQQYIDVQDSSNTFIIYLKLVDVPLNSEGYYHTTGNFYCVQSGGQNSFRGDMNYYSGTVSQGKANNRSAVGNVIIGCYGEQHPKIADSITPPTVDSSLSDFVDYINNVSWSPTGSSPMILYYDKTIGSFVCSASKGGAVTLDSSYTTPPWPIP